MVLDGSVIGRSHNRPIAACDPTAHAEIGALRRAARRMSNYRLTGATLYVTLEPCLMCVGAIIHARIERLVFGAGDPKVGAITLAGQLAGSHALNHRFEVIRGVMADSCRDLLQDYFRGKR